jgi:ribose transport system permease protein
LSEIVQSDGTTGNTLTTKLLSLLKIREIGVLAALLLMCIIMSIASPYFLGMNNIFNVMRNMSTIGIMAIGMTMIIVTAGIDLSVGSMLAVTAIVMARLMFHGVGTLPAVLAGLATGAILGGTNGLLITRLNLTPFIPTLGMLSIARGFTVWFATGLKGSVASNISVKNSFVEFIGGGYIGPIPMPVIIMFVLVLFFSFFLKRTVLGRQIYAIGSNEEAAMLSGVKVARVKLFVYTLMGLLSGLAGIMTAGLLSTAATNAGTGNELDVIAAVVIGGASLQGGKGSVWGAIIGAAIMAVLRNSFVLLHLPGFVQTISIGVVIILAVSIDSRKQGS